MAVPEVMTVGVMLSALVMEIAAQIMTLFAVSNCSISNVRLCNVELWTFQNLIFLNVNLIIISQIYGYRCKAETSEPRGIR